MDIMGFHLVTTTCLLGNLLWHYGLTADSIPLVHCGHPDYTEVCFENSVQSRLVYTEFEPAVIRCVVRNLGRFVVTWMRNDSGNIPLTVGRTVFTPDRRIMIDYSSPDEWNLVIRGAHVQDSGEYLCQVNWANQLMEKTFHLSVKESEPVPMSPDRSQSGPRQPPAHTEMTQGGQPPVPPGKASKPLQNDESDAASQEMSRGAKSVHIYGRSLVFKDEQFVSFTCTAVFLTPDARRNSAATVEWYHQGLRQASNASSMDVSMSWKDGDTAVSVLTLYSVLLSHAGEWVCLKRPSELADGLETASHHLTVLEREDITQQRQQPHQMQRTYVESLGLGSRGSGSNSQPTSLVIICTLVAFVWLLRGQI